MIIKTMGRKGNIERTINYLFKDEAKLKKDGSKPIVIRKNLRSRILENVIKEFKVNEEMRVQKRSDRIKLYHTVISFHAKDSKYLNEKALKDFTREYMKERGNNIYIATAHFDKGHQHIHIAESGSGYMTGKANSMPKAEYRELKMNMQAFQQTKYPELANSLPKHGRKLSPKEVAIGSRETKKQSLLACLSLAEKNSKNMKDFLEEIRKGGHEPYHRGGKLSGIKYDGDTKFRFSGLGYKEKVEELSNRFEEDKQQLDELEDLRSNASSRDQENDSRDRGDDDKDEEMETEMDDDYEDDYGRE
jgi:Relaxase/Mobilisation nuclease domain